MPKPYFSVALDCEDPASLSRFYGELLDLPVVFEAGAYAVLEHIEPNTAHLIFQKVPESHPGSKIRCHLDLHIVGLEEKTSWVLAHGGTRGEDVHELGMHWRTMHDPEGNVFCLMELDTDRAPMI